MAIFTAITAHLAAAGFTGAVSIFGLSPAVSAIVLNIGRTALYSIGLAALQRRPTLPKQRYQAQIQEAVQSRVKGYGRVRLGGQRVFFESRDGSLHVVTAHHAGEVHALEGFMVDTHDVVLDDDGITSDGGDFDFGRRLQLDWRNGTAADYTRLRSDFSIEWTEAHQLNGLTHSYMRASAPSLEKFSKQIPSGENTAVSLKVDATPVFDPRTGFVTSSTNPALAIRDYLTSQQGMRIGAAFIDSPSFEAFADVCDVEYPLASGGFHKRYTLGGAFALTDEPRDILPRMQATCDSFLYFTTEGQVAISGGQYSEPDFTLSSDDILSIQWETGQDLLTDFNVLKGVYTSPGHDFKDQQAPEIRDETSLAERGEQIQSHEVLWCTDGVQMQRLMKSYKAMALPKVRATLRTNLVGMKARFPKGDGVHTIRIDHARIGGVYLVLDHSFDIDTRECVIEVQSIEDAWGWDFTEEQELAPTLDELAQVQAEATLPSDLQVTQRRVQVGSVQGFDGETPIYATEMQVRVRDPDRDDLNLVVEYADIDFTGDFLGKAINWISVPNPTDSYVATVQLAAGTNYRVRASYSGVDVAESSLPTQEILIASEPIQPDPPSDFDASLNGVIVRLTWRNPAKNHARTWLYRGTTDDFGKAEFILDLPGTAGAMATATDAPGLGDWYYWAVSVSSVYAASNPSGPSIEAIT